MMKFSCKCISVLALLALASCDTGYLKSDASNERFSGKNFLGDELIPLSQERLQHSQNSNVARNVLRSTLDGFLLLNPQYQVKFSSLGIQVNSLTNGISWSWSGVGFQQVKPAYDGSKVYYERGNITEQYIIKENTVEQQFIIHRPIAGDHPIIIDGQITSNGDFSETETGSAWKNEFGQVTVSDVFVFDAMGKTLPLVSEITPQTSHIELKSEALGEAEYPILVDPEIGTNDFRISTLGTDGDVNYSSTNSSIAYNSASNIYLVVWEGAVAGETEIWGQLLNGTTGATSGSAFQISDMGPAGNAAYDALAPDVASSGSSFLVVWYADDDTSPLVDNEFEIFGQLVTASTGALSGTNFRISDMGTDGNTSFSATVPAVVFNTTQNEFLVVWTGDDNTGSLVDNENEIYGQRISTAGAEIGTNDFRISDMGSTDGSTLYAALAPDVAWNSGNNQYMVVWHGDDDAFTVDNEFEIFIQRLDGTSGGSVGSNDAQVSDMGPNADVNYRATNPAISSLGSNYLIVWRGDDNTSPLVDNENEIFGQLVTNAGAATGTNDFRISDMGADGNVNYEALNPAIASDPNLNLYLVTWQGDDNTVPLLDNEFEIYGQLITSGGAESGSDVRLSDVGGSGSTSLNAARPSAVYNGAAREFLLIWDADDNAGSMVDNEFEIFGQRFAELQTEPASQPTSPVFSSITSSSFTVAFTAAAGSPDGYIVLRKSGSSPTEIPADHSVYSLNDVIGTSTVAYVGSALTFNESSLTANTSYFYDFFSYSGVNSSTNYKTTTPLEGSVTTLASEPSTQGTLSFSVFGTNSIQVTLSAGNGSSRLLVAKAGSAVDVFPVDGTSYTPNNNIASAPNLGSSNFVVGSGTGTITVTGLSLATVYHFRVFELNGSGAQVNYNTSAITNSTGSKSTLSADPTAQPTAINFTSVTNNSFTVGFTAASGSPSGYIAIRKSGSAPAQPGDLPVDGTSYSVGNTIGGSTVTYIGSTASFGESSLSAATEYYYLILSYNGSGANINYRETTPLSGNRFTLSNEPSAQPTAIVFSNLATTSFTVGFTAASGSPGGYLVLRKSGSAPSDVPVDATAYTAGNTIGTSTVAYVGATAGFNDTGLSTNTIYHYAVFSYNGSATTLNYLAGAPLTGNRTTLQTEPSAQPTGISFSAVTSSSMDGSFSVAAGSPAGYIVLRKAASSPTDVPDDGTAYSAGATIGTSTVVYAGSTPSFSSTGLSSGVVYHYDVFSFNGGGSSINYLIASPLEGSQVTTLAEPTTQPAALVFSAITTSSMDGSFTVAADNPAGYIVLRKTGSSPADTPVDGVSYSVGGTIGTSTVAHIGSAITFSNTGLTANTVYHYDVFSYNGAGATFNYLITSPLEGSQTTLTGEPTSQPSALVFSNHTTTSYTVSFTAAAGSPEGYVVIRKQGSAPTGVPADGSVYTVGAALGDGSVASVGNSLTVNETELTPGTTYSYKIFAYNGAGAATNYLTSSAPGSSTITLCNAPLFDDVNILAGQTTLTIPWAAVTGAANYALEISTDNFSTFVGAYSPKIISATSESVTGLSTGTIYKFRVRALNASGSSANSTEKEKITIPATPVINTPTQILQDKFDISWSAISGATKYFLDVSESPTFIGFVHNSKEVTGTGHTVDLLAPGITYYLRLRSNNSSGTSPSSTPAIVQATLPQTPSPSSSNVTEGGFKVTWPSATGATSYELEVSANDFVNLVAPYNPAVITGGELEKIVVGLTANTVYKFRVRSNSSVGYSPFSIPISVQTLEITNPNPLTINPSPSNPQTLPEGFGITKLNVTVTGGSPPRTVLMHHRGILGDTFTSVTATIISGDNYEVNITATMLDDFGIEYYFEATDQTTAKPVSPRAYIYMEVPVSLQKIPGLESGGKAQDYRVFSIPYKLEDNLVQSIFGKLGNVDKAKWRLVHYENGANVDYPGFNRIEHGYGYWFNSLKPVEITTGTGTVPRNNQSTPLTITLAQGWNQIGDPYPFDIDWSDVQAANPTIAVGSLKVYDPVTVGLKTQDDLKKWSGGFVFADAGGQLVFPVTLKNSFSQGGRKAKSRAINSDIDQPEWLVALALKHGIGENDMIGIGMHPEASESKDRFDEISVPRFVKYLEMETKHKEYFAPYFTRDVVPTADQYTWNFSVHSNFGDEKATLTWNSESLGNRASKLILYDVEAQQFVDMKVVNQYSFSVGDGRKFKFLYARDEHQWQPDFTTLGKPYPNPSSGWVTLPLIVQEELMPIAIEVLDIFGKQVKELVNQLYNPGIYDVGWNGEDNGSRKVPAGMYLIQMKLGSGPQKVVYKITMK